MKYAVVTKHGVEIVEAENMYDYKYRHLCCACDILEKECDVCDEDFCFFVLPISRKGKGG